MKPLVEGGIELRNALILIEQNLATYSGHWNDAAQRYFEDEFMQPILMETPSLIEQMQELSLVFDRARHEVE